MDHELTLWSLFAEASLLVQGVMLLLLLASLFSWYFIFLKWQQLRQAQQLAHRFDQRFWSGIDLVDLFRQLSRQRETLSGNEAIFEAGFGEYARMRRQGGGGDPMAVVEGSQRAMRVVLMREVDKLDSHLTFLATVGSISPYIGLFGTVWGIMNAFRGLGQVEHATLAMVAPGIAEALVATAMGLFAAIPAVVAYKRFSSEVARLEGRYDGFKDELATLLQRQALHQAAGGNE
jgi:biopolymer transport protein TolQ